MAEEIFDAIWIGFPFAIILAYINSQALVFHLHRKIEKRKKDFKKDIKRAFNLDSLSFSFFSPKKHFK